MAHWLHPRRWGVRGQAAVASMLVLLLALAIASGLLLLLLKNSLENAAQANATVRADQVAAALTEDSAEELDQVLLTTDGNTLVIQIVDTATGQIVRSSLEAPIELLSASRPAAGASQDLGKLDLGSAGEYWVVAQGVTGADATYVVIVGAHREGIEAVFVTVAVLLAIGVPIIVGLAGVMTFALVGRSLRPVEAIRRQVAEISSSDLNERVPVPSSADEIAQLALTMNDMLARLQAGQAAQQGFVGDASHELRSPLATLVAALELAHQRPELLDPDLVTETLLPETKRMQQLVNDLLLLATADERGLHPRLREVDLDDVLIQEVQRARALAETGITSHRPVFISSDITPIRIEADPSQITRAVRNVLENALRHCNGVVRVQAKQLGGEAIIHISDDGPGIPEADRERVLQRFVRLDTDRSRSAGGTGLGLAIVNEIVAAHHGSISIKCSASSGGTDFVLTLPLPRASV